MIAVLDPSREIVFNKLSWLGRVGHLGGGTAIALQLAHRRSFDFDIMSDKLITPSALPQFEEHFSVVTPLVNTSRELTVSVEAVKCSLIYFPYPPLEPLVDGFPLPLVSLADSAGNKAYALGRRGTYRDYVDLYALLQHGLTLPRIIQNARQRFGEAFNERLFLQQLMYSQDLDNFTVDWLWPERSPEAIDAFLKSRVEAYLR